MLHFTIEEAILGNIKDSGSDKLIISVRKSQIEKESRRSGNLRFTEEFFVERCAHYLIFPVSKLN